MFEVSYTLSALVESDDHGQRIFKIFQHGEPDSEGNFSLLLATIFQEEVYQTLHPGDTLIITMHHDLAEREIEKTLRFRSDRLFEGDGLPEATPDLLPFISAMYQHFSQRVLPGGILTISYHLQRL
jgi:hypothetical protein